jgi:hypothetical protein
VTVCAVHGYHWPKPIGVVVHHIQPLAAGGPDVAANRVTICPTGHLNVHRLLDLLWRTSPADPDAIKGKGTRKERALARQGFDAWVTAGKPGHPVFESSKPSG